MSDPLDLAAIRARCAAATPGPWGRTTSNDAHWLREVRDANGRGVAWCGHEEKQAHEDAAFIAASRQDVPALVEEVERLRAKVSDMRSEAVRAEERHRADRDRLAAELERVSKERDEARDAAETNRSIAEGGGYRFEGIDVASALVDAAIARDALRAQLAAVEAARDEACNLLEAARSLLDRNIATDRVLARLRAAGKGDK